MAVVDIAEERRVKQLGEKFKIKGAHERDITPISRLVYVILHIASGIGAISSLFYMNFDSQLEKFLYFIVFGALAVINEVLKGRKMEYFTTVTIIASDPDKQMEEREKAHDEKMKSMLPVLFFWLVSVGAVGWTGYSFGENKVNFRFTAENYDEMIRETAKNAITAVQYGTANGYSAKKIQQLTNDQNTAVANWNAHRTQIDNANKKNKNVNEDEAMVMGLVYVLIAIALEALLFFARLWHEKEQYDVLKSKLKAQKQASNSEKQASNSEKQKETEKKNEKKKDVVMSADDYELVSRQYANTQLALADSMKKISLLEDALRGK